LLKVELNTIQLTKIYRWQYDCLVESEIKVILKKNPIPLIQMFLAMLWLGLGLWCLTPLSTILLVEGAGEYPEKTIDLPNVTHKLYHIYCIVYTSGLFIFFLVISLRSTQLRTRVAQWVRW
jgi:hypothetical protein